MTYVKNAVLQTEKNINIFTFGIGEDANTQLLTLLALQNNGLSDFLATSELESKITDFYLKVRNPVLLNTVMSFTPSNVITECYPNPLPNLYKGQQLLVTGRYNENTNITVHLSGKAFGQNVSYDFPLQLSAQNIPSNMFLTKAWAKSKIENLTFQYYALNENSAEAAAIKQQIIQLSMRYGVISDFTSFISSSTNVEFATFTGIKISGGVMLEWRTGRESNNEGFTIERKYGWHEWESIGYVKGNGNSFVQSSYNFKDALEGVYVKGYVSYRLKQIDSDGSVSYSKVVEVFVNNLPNSYSLDQNYPNPFNPSTKISYSIPSKENVSIKIFDVLGNLIKVLVNEVKDPGQYEVTFTADGLSSGVYFYRMESGDFSMQKKFLFLK